jgi:hypothetical protein
MTSREQTFVKLLTGFLYGLTVFIFVGIIMWFWPRQVVKSASEMMTDKTLYKSGEQIYVKGETWTNVDSSAEFDVRLICNGVKYNYATIERLNVSKQQAPIKYNFEYPRIPFYIPEGKCTIETTAIYPLQILPLLDRDYQYVFRSNEFEIKESM